MLDDFGEVARKRQSVFRLELDLVARGLGVRSTRYSLLADDGVVKALNVEEGGKFEVSSAEKLLEEAEKVTNFIP